MSAQLASDEIVMISIKCHLMESRTMWKKMSLGMHLDDYLHYNYWWGKTHSLWVVLFSIGILFCIREGADQHAFASMSSLLWWTVTWYKELNKSFFLKWTFLYIVSWQLEKKLRWCFNYSLLNSNLSINYLSFSLWQIKPFYNDTYVIFQQPEPFNHQTLSGITLFSICIL